MRGQKLVRLRVDLGIHNVEIYPREGTETRRNPATNRQARLKFIPVRGRKRDDLLVVLHFDC